MKRIFLIGYMGSGKTTLGKSLARLMNLNHIDTDHLIESRFRKKVADIFVSEGEERFRQIEHRILLEVSEYENVVISTGGGLPCFNNNMAVMNDRGTTVYLDVPVEVLAKRLKEDKNVRPILKNCTGNELIDYIGEHLEMRKRFYEQAKIQFQAEQVHPKGNIESLARKLELCITKDTEF